ncbi:MAG: lysophospholipid acyltransferase family protein, partial [Chloroflexota bacterium]
MAVHDSEEIAHEHIKAPPVAVGAALTEVRVSGRVHLARSSAEQAYQLLDGLVSVSDRRTWVKASVGLGFWLGAPVHLLRTLGRAGRRSELHAVSRWWARGLRRHLHLRLELSGLEHIDPHEAYIVAPLHEGFADAVALLHLPLNMRFVARDELFGWRHFGGLLKDTGQVMVTPESGLLSYRELRRRAPAILDAGESLLIAPQGSVLGLEIDFRIGPFALAAALGRPILPVALTGTHRVWE